MVANPSYQLQVDPVRWCHGEQSVELVKGCDPSETAANPGLVSDRVYLLMASAIIFGEIQPLAFGCCGKIGKKTVLCHPQMLKVMDPFPSNKLPSPGT